MSGLQADLEIDVDIVRARLRDFADLHRLRAILSPQERSRADAHKFDEPRDSFILTRGLLRIELAGRLGLPAAGIHFESRPSGKPDLRSDIANPPEWRFSVSHTGAEVALAFARGTDVGIDIEPLDRRMDPLAIAKRYFTPRELEALLALPSDARARAFIAGWTRKEAIVKARGDTMAASLASLSVDLDPSNPRPGYDDSIPGRPVCRLAAIEFKDENLIGAVAVCGAAAPRLEVRVRSGASFD